MEKAEQRIQSEDIRNASILPKWNDICNADMNELYAIQKIFFYNRKGMICFQRGINLIFSLFNEGDNIVFSSLRYENDLNIRGNFI